MSELLYSVNPKTKEKINPGFREASSLEIERALENADLSFKSYQKVTAEERASFLEHIAKGIEGAGDELVQMVMQESGLPEKRVKGERGRTCGQLRKFAAYIRNGTWVEASIDRAIPDREPLPKVDIRRMLRPVGPVLIFTASNFPLAFSTAGGDTASALAAGCSVIVKAHPSHLGTNAIVSTIIREAATKNSLPADVFQSLDIVDYELAGILVTDERIKSIAFTGSQRGGKAIFDRAQKRKTPIPVFAEMGSVNPVCILPEKIKKDGSKIAKTIAHSVNMGVGQFCTNPGLIFVMYSNEVEEFKDSLKNEILYLDAHTMLNQGIFENYTEMKRRMELNPKVVFRERNAPKDEWLGRPAMGMTSSEVFLEDESLREEVFGPFTLLVLCPRKEDLMQCIDALEGQLTASIWATEKELEEHQDIYNRLAERVGRIMYNNMPTGVEVCDSMHHGGPCPATTDSRYTSVGTSAIKRFARPVCFQNIPHSLLPAELRDDNPLNIQRWINGEWSKE